MKNALVIALILLLCIIPLIYFETLESSQKETSYKDATQEVNQLAQNQKPKPKDETALIILSNFANMVGNFANIVKDPDDSNQVGAHLANMFQGVINIAMQAFKSGKLCRNPSTKQIKKFIYELLDDDDIRETLLLIISLKAQEIKKV